MWGVVDVSVWTNPCLSVPNIVLSRENPLAAGYSKADLPELQPLYCIIWKAVAGRVHCAVRVEPNGHEWCMGCRNRHLEFTVNLLSCIQGKTAHCCGLFSKAVSKLLWTTLLFTGSFFAGQWSWEAKLGDHQNKVTSKQLCLEIFYNVWPMNSNFSRSKSELAQNTLVCKLVHLNPHAHTLTERRSRCHPACELLANHSENTE